MDTDNIPLQPLKTVWLSSTQTEAVMLRLDLLHPQVSGNKWFKLKYNIEAAIQQNKDTILTFGGVRSNHIAATAAAARYFKIKSVGIIRGEAIQADNPTLQHATKNGMQLHFISREAYRHKATDPFLQELQNKFPRAFIVPEGGNNLLGIKGAGEILQLCNTSHFTHICCPVGTGTTLAGLIAAARPSQEIIGFSALKKAKDQCAFIERYLSTMPDHAGWKINTDYHFGGFAKRSKQLNDFMLDFYTECDVELDFVYTAKMMFGIKDLVEQKYFPSGSKLLIIHTGGLQGNAG